MHAIDDRVADVVPLPGAGSRSRHQSRERHQETPDGTYGYPVPASASRDPRVLAFARFIKRALDQAGMSIDQVEERTGLKRSTIYRWHRAEVESPRRKQVQQFCDGLGISRTVASQILGWDGTPPSPEPDPAVDPDLRAVMRRLTDPAVSAEEKTVIRATLRYLAKGG